ncbi:MAG: WYL domain-containing protein [Thermoflexibacter sp.]|jgi:predicted DNA-binding transcriptional regulator YafY|nr:WYL domain-containing protein [Thermoflexibacter sp.]
MSINKLALIRYKTIDECLQNRQRKWTLEDLIEKVSEAIYENEGIRSGVSKRTIQADIQVMRSDKLGYNAPIIVIDKKYYTYQDKKYSITKTPINQGDVSKLKEIVSLLKQFNGFGYFEEMSEVVAKLENNLNKSYKQGKNYIQFESNKLLKGIGYIHPLYQAILQKKALLIDYKSFKAKNISQQIYYPYLLKEYRNRWFLIAKAKGKNVLITLALDRIISLQEIEKEDFVEHEGVDFETYYDDLIGVTKSEKDKPQRVVLQVDKLNAPYILTKPLHSSQSILKEDENGVILSIEVILNFELEREILGFGEAIKVLAPRFLVKKIKYRLEKTLANYLQNSNS